LETNITPYTTWSAGGVSFRGETSFSRFLNENGVTSCLRGPAVGSETEKPNVRKHGKYFIFKSIENDNIQQLGAKASFFL
jgi:hypothetical protein